MESAGWCGVKVSLGDAVLHWIHLPATTKTTEQASNDSQSTCEQFYFKVSFTLFPMCVT